MLIRCGDCGNNISSLSEHCIFCGWPTKYYSPQPCTKIPQPIASPTKDTNIALKASIELHKVCFKIDSINAYSMIHGFRQNNTICHTSIWIDVRERHFPALISLNRSHSKLKPSNLGISLNAHNLKLQNKYITTMVGQHFIKNDINLWKTICSNGLFDIWNPQAPYDRLAKSKSSPKLFRICLLRVFEIDHKFQDSDVLPVSDRIDHLVAHSREVNIVKPVMCDEEFGEMKRLLERSVTPYLQK